jgi:hypothetical protein
VSLARRVGEWGEPAAPAVEPGVEERIGFRTLEDRRQAARITGREISGISGA